MLVGGIALLLYLIRRGQGLASSVSDLSLPAYGNDPGSHSSPTWIATARLPASSDEDASASSEILRPSRGDGVAVSLGPPVPLLAIWVRNVDVKGRMALDQSSSRLFDTPEMVEAFFSDVIQRGGQIDLLIKSLGPIPRNLRRRPDGAKISKKVWL